MTNNYNPPLGRPFPMVGLCELARANAPTHEPLGGTMSFTGPQYIDAMINGLGNDYLRYRQLLANDCR